jgi:hypothetical protein
MLADVRATRRPAERALSIMGCIADEFHTGPTAHNMLRRFQPRKAR